MLNTIRFVDNFLIDRCFQILADWYYGITKRTNFGLAALLFMVLSFADFMILLIIYKNSGVLTLYSIARPLVTASFARDALVQEGIIGASGTANPYRFSWFWMFVRYACIALLLPASVKHLLLFFSNGDLLEGTTGLGLVVYFVAFYVMACSSKPPPEKEEKLVPVPAAG